MHASSDVTYCNFVCKCINNRPRYLNMYEKDQISMCHKCIMILNQLFYNMVHDKIDNKLFRKDLQLIQ